VKSFKFVKLKHHIKTWIQPVILQNIEHLFICVEKMVVFGVWNVINDVFFTQLFKVKL